MDTIGPAHGYRGMIFESYYVVAGTPEVQEANSTTERLLFRYFQVDCY